MRTRIAIAAGALLALVAVALFARAHWGSVYDDALIYLRYVRNLDHGCGLRFNCHGEPVEGFTGPLYLAVLWLGSLVTDELIDLCQVVGVISVAVAAGFAVATAAAACRDERLAPYVAVATGLALALDPYVLLNANIGMETALAAATIAVVAYAAVTQRPALVVVMAVTAALVRPEAMLFVVALPALPWLRKPRYLVPAAAALIAITAARLIIFGLPLPNTYYAKSGGTWRHAALGAAYIGDAIRDFPLAALAPIVLLAAPRRASAYVLGVAAVWLGFFLRTGGDTFEYSRLWFPLVPALTALALAGISRLRVRYPAVVVAACALLAGGRAAVGHAIPDQHTNARVVEWAAIGDFLRAHYPRGTLVATVPIGAIGYYSSLPILDLVGLTDQTIARAGRSVPPDLLDKRWIGHERHDTEYVLDRRPAVIVTTMHRDRAWTLDDAKAGFWADWLLLEEVKAGRAPYHVRDAEVAPGDHVLMLER